jgi:hypothetical protein
VGTRSPICPKGWMVWVAWTLHATHTIQPLGQVRYLVPTLPPPYPIHVAHIYVLYNCLLFHIQPEDGHYQEPKHVVVLCVISNLYISPSDSCVRQQIHSNLVYTCAILF